ncbi:MAG TPA: hypothetical protein VMU94_07910 [Streptosporangiaceae bacterium]|nr:hypothetical protein [Streptosporangiaceae bacterium]
MHFPVTRLLAAAGTVAAAVAGGGLALAVTAGPASTATGPTFECIKIGAPGTHYIERTGIVPRACSNGYVLVGIGQRGPAGPATLSVTGSTAISGRDDSGNGTGSCTASTNTDCWATDSFMRIMTVTRNGAAPAANCGSSATQCWLYTASLADSGTFVTVKNGQTPNQQCTEPNGGPSCTGLVISATVSGSLSGGGKMEFYASNPSPSTTGVPATATGNSPLATTDWYTLFFPAGTKFGLTNASQAPWTTWSWTYSAPSTCEQWVDSMADNSGDGTYAADGNIAGINQCG